MDRHQAGDRVRPDSQPDRGPPARAATKVDDSDVGSERGQVAVQRCRVGQATAGHGEGSVKVSGAGQPQQRVHRHHHGDRDRAGRDCLTEPAELTAGELAYRQGCREEHQRQPRRDPQQGEQHPGQIVSCGRDVRFRASCGGPRHQACAGQQGECHAPGDQPEQIGRFADAALKIFLDDDGCRAGRAGSRWRIGPA